MRGSLKNIDICAILRLLALGQRTGVLLIESNKSYTFPDIRGNQASSLFQWLIFCVSGQVVYATTENTDCITRLKDHLSYYKAEEALDDLDKQSLGAISPPEYSAIWLLLERKILSLSQGKNIVQNMTEEVLFEILSLREGNFVFKDGLALAPELIALETENLLTKIGKQVQQWCEFYPEIQFFDQCLIVSNENKLRSALPKKAYYNLSNWADGKTSLQKIARYLNCDLVTLAKAVYPCVQRGWIEMKNPIPSKVESPENIQQLNRKAVLVNKELSSLDELNHQLQSQGYETFLISDAAEALKVVLQNKPDLVICAAELTGLNGYQFCSIIRDCLGCQNTKLFILAEDDNFLNQVKAKIAGASCFWSEPLDQQQLLSLG